MLTLVLLGALKAPLCLTVPEGLTGRLGPSWTLALEGRLNRPVVLAPSCPGEALRVTLNGELATVTYQPAGRWRTFLLESEEVLTLLAATMVDPSVRAEPLEPLEPAAAPVPVPVPAPAPAPAQEHEHLWMYAGSGVGFASGWASLALHAGAAYRFEAWSLGGELVTLGNPGLPGETRSRIGIGPVAWYGHGTAVRVDGGLGLGFAAVSAPWASPSGARYGELMAGLVRLMVRVRWAPSRWLGAYARAEADLVVPFAGASGVDSFAALQLGVEVTL
jgi:hypothetical protein